MFHSNTELLIDRWQAQAGPKGVPARADYDLTPIARLAPQLFIVGRRQAGQYPFRLVGDLVRDLHGRRLLGDNLMDFFSIGARTELRPALEAARRNGSTLVADLAAHSDSGQSFDLEMTFAPLAGPGGDTDRFLGLYQPLTPVFRLRGELVVEFSLKALHAGAPGTPRLRLAALDGRQIA